MIRRLWTVLREVAWLPVTWWKVRQDASVDARGNLLSDRGWTYRLPLYPAKDVTDPVVLAAIARGQEGAVRETVPLRQLTATGTGGPQHAAKEG